VFYRALPFVLQVHASLATLSCFEKHGHASRKLLVSKAQEGIPICRGIVSQLDSLQSERYELYRRSKIKPPSMKKACLFSCSCTASLDRLARDLSHHDVAKELSMQAVGH
jgi:hypothetical protein